MDEVSRRERVDDRSERRLTRLVPQGRLKYEMDGAQRIKRIVFDKSGR